MPSAALTLRSGSFCGGGGGGLINIPGFHPRDTSCTPPPPGCDIVKCPRQGPWAETSEVPSEPLSMSPTGTRRDNGQEKHFHPRRASAQAPSQLWKVPGSLSGSQPPGFVDPVIKCCSILFFSSEKCLWNQELKRKV